MHAREYQRSVVVDTAYVEPKRPQVQTGLNLFLDLKSPAQMPALLHTIESQMDSVRSALDGLHYVHFARFLPTRDGATLLVITEFDGDLKPYIMDFVAVLGPVFTAILRFVKDAPRLPVNRYPRDFWEFVQKNDLSQVQPWSAYKHMTVLDIQGVRRPVPKPVQDPDAATLDLTDIQGNVLIGYNAQFAHHFALKITDRTQARQFIEALLPGGDGIQVSTAVICDEPPPYMLNIGFTWRGLRALGLADHALNSFPDAFRRGPAFRDSRNNIDIPATLGDIDESDPEKWCFGNPTKPDDLSDLMVSVLTKDAKELEARTAELQKLVKRFGLRDLMQPCKPASLTKRKIPGEVHFGYRDGIAQPRIAGLPGWKKCDDMQPAVPAGDFLLGKDYVNTYGGNFAGDLPRALCDNGTYAAVRIMMQEVKKFEEFLDAAAERTGVPKDPADLKPWQAQREWIAAKMMGRWRDGKPITLAATNEAAVPPERINDFDFAPSGNSPTYFDDYDGMRCPVSAHIRRLNPRGSLVTGKPHSRRIIRRGMPYGPAYDSEKRPKDRIERGLFGVFICGDLEMQLEFLLSTWTNKDISTAGIRGMRDPIAGAQASYGGKFVVRTTDHNDPIVLDVPQLVATRGSDYFFLPGIGGLKYLAQLEG